jgi:hypothetical protein
MEDPNEEADPIEEAVGAVKSAVGAVQGAVRAWLSNQHGSQVRLQQYLSMVWPMFAIPLVLFSLPSSIRWGFLGLGLGSVFGNKNWWGDRRNAAPAAADSPPAEQEELI